MSIEDGCAEDDWDGLEARSPQKLGGKVQLVGDDLFVTNVERLEKRHRGGRGQRHPHQAEPDRHAHRDARLHPHGAREPATASVISHRSGETEDTFIADLAVATNAGQIKTGSLSRSDRVAKYNQLLLANRFELGSRGGYVRGLRDPPVVAGNRR